jgi:CRISPR/Cas system-associated exonuclease Cas4 (RecB family)
MGDFKNKFGWSASRGRLYARCKRAYWYRYYGMWEGWRSRNVHPGRRIAYRLSKMTGLVPWSGTIVHDVVEWAVTRIAKGLAVDQPGMRARARAEMVKGWRESRGSDWVSKPKYFLNLSEMYYDGETPELAEKAGAMRDRVNLSIKNWWDLGWPELLAGLDVDDWVELEGLSTIRFRGEVDIFVQPDLAFWRSGRLFVIDWKTGKPKEADERQIRIYVIWAMKRGTPLADIRAQLVYLGAVKNEKTLSFTTPEIRTFADDLWSEIETVRGALHNQEHNVARAEDFPMVEDRKVCEWCEYRQLCHGRGDAPGPAKANDPILIEAPEGWPR